MRKRANFKSKRLAVSALLDFISDRNGSVGEEEIVRQLRLEKFSDEEIQEALEVISKMTDKEFRRNVDLESPNPSTTKSDD
jgi:hypothetical protein